MPAATGATVNFTTLSTSAQIQFLSPPPLSNGIIGGYAYYNGSDFATLTGTANTVGAVTYTNGDLAAAGAAANVMPSGTQTTIAATKHVNSLNLTGGTSVTMNNSTGLLCLIPAA